MRADGSARAGVPAKRSVKMSEIKRQKQYGCAERHPERAVGAMRAEYSFRNGYGKCARYFLFSDQSYGVSTTLNLPPASSARAAGSDTYRAKNRSTSGVKSSLYQPKIGLR